MTSLVSPAVSILFDLCTTQNLHRFTKNASSTRYKHDFTANKESRNESTLVDDHDDNDSSMVEVKTKTTTSSLTG